MPDRLYRAVYVSRTVSDGHGTSARLADAIAEHAAERNRAAGVTGILLVHEEWFVQALEGGRAAVSDLLLEIGGDSRHREMEIAAFQPIDRRLFPDWSMALARYEDEMGRLLDAVSDERRFDPKRLEPVVLLMLLSEARKTVPLAA